MYESPIHLLVQQLETAVREKEDKYIFEAIQKFGVDVDRDELIKALAYDRDQYDKGYADGRADAQRWINVEERLPENDDYVLVYIGEVTDIGFYSKCGYWECLTVTRRNDVTHWMPLPEPPKEETA